MGPKLIQKKKKEKRRRRERVRSWIKTVRGDNINESISLEGWGWGHQDDSRHCPLTDHPKFKSFW